MAKKKDKETVSSLLAGMMGLVTREDTKHESGGVELKTFAERWLYDSNVIRFGELYMFAGESASGKSQFMINTMANFIKAGGMAFLIDTEHKSNAEASIIPNIGEDIYYSGRFGYSTAGSIDAAKAMKKGDEDATEEQLKAWQDMLRQRVQTIKADPELAAIPIFMGVDSLLGAASSIARDKYDEGGGSDGRSGAGMARAASITDFLASFSTDLAGTNITVGFVNHGKTKINMGYAGNYGPQIQLPGGDAPKFHCSTILYFKKGSPVKKSNLGGRSVRINVYKNSFGDDQRNLEVTFYYDILRDANGIAVRDDNGNPRRRIFWDWDEATAQILKRYCISDKDKIGAAKAIFPGLSMSGNKVSCKTYNFDKLSMTEFGKEIMANEDLYQKIMEIPRLSLHHAPAGKVVTPDWSADVLQSADEGSWEQDKELMDEEADV